MVAANWFSSAVSCGSVLAAAAWAAAAPSVCFWASVMNAAARGGPVASVGVDTWGVDYALLGEGGVLLENPYHYRDARTIGMVEKAAAALGAERGVVAVAASYGHA